MVRCTVSGRLQARGPGCLPDVAVAVQLKNEGPHPISKSWVAILECKPSQEGGLSIPKLFILLAHPRRSAVLLRSLKVYIYRMPGAVSQPLSNRYCLLQRRCAGASPLAAWQ